MPSHDPGSTVRPGEAIAQGLLYGLFGLGFVAAGWFGGFLYANHHDSGLPFGMLVWTLVALLSPVALVAAFVARPVRAGHRTVWALAALVGRSVCCRVGIFWRPPSSQQVSPRCCSFPVGHGGGGRSASSTSGRQRGLWLV